MEAARKRIAGWMMFDWASQPYNTLLLTFIFSPYFATVVGDPVAAQAMWGYMLTATGLTIAVLAPVLGALADQAGRRMPWILAFSVLYLVGASMLWIAVPGAEAVVLILFCFGLGLIGMEFATIFTNAMLPDLGPKAELGRISGTGWAVGYAGGVVALILMLLFFAENEAGVTLLGIAPVFGLDPEMREGTRSVGPFVALWFVVFMIPFFLWVRETPPVPPRRTDLRAGLKGLADTLRRLPGQRSLAAYLASSMFYRDALNGMYTFGGIYALGVLEWSVIDIGIFGIMAAITGAVFAYIGGFADRAFGPKPVIAVCIVILTGVGITIVSVSREAVFGMPVAPDSTLPDTIFYICGALIGAAGGVLQAASRTMMVRQASRGRMTEAFGLYALAGKATSFLAPLTIAIATDLSGTQSAGLIPLIALFLCGLGLLRFVHPDPETSSP
ncbi:major facilitator superfamily (MFS) transporter [Dinoroseobacter shibae DFL 12 = DSM 16493]|jgi:UMF1 family MFS transporter|uniref:Major facilitator superfamily (MFS) transporter n=1 Tax=Dinoroseobacter shibae (strain DSM 16493 / NCIMB 14021 / DFL 12) TaxID=398580 RepID=A8LNH6_DINSH|nr:MFS transporter [Dinoroseobacter shibae]ABV95070.1 major facilitator superfamily (MFS) transporter [Dinoroseobacter shibae DFL 12 = DSM 16493]URF46485.1 MFS transporter [Dinoroseobacter shibae]URF50791.1 MFS transporter [Dinoroseobacter shibae]